MVVELSAVEGGVPAAEAGDVVAPALLLLVGALDRRRLASRLVLVAAVLGLVEGLADRAGLGKRSFSFLESLHICLGIVASSKPNNPMDFSILPSSLSQHMHPLFSKTWPRSRAPSLVRGTNPFRIPGMMVRHFQGGIFVPCYVVE